MKSSLLSALMFHEHGSVFRYEVAPNPQFSIQCADIRWRFGPCHGDTQICSPAFSRACQVSCLIRAFSGDPGLTLQATQLYTNTNKQRQEEVSAMLTFLHPQADDCMARCLRAPICRTGRQQRHRIAALGFQAKLGFRKAGGGRTLQYLASV